MSTGIVQLARAVLAERQHREAGPLARVVGIGERDAAEIRRLGEHDSRRRRGRRRRRNPTGPASPPRRSRRRRYRRARRAARGRCGCAGTRARRRRVQCSPSRSRRNRAGLIRRELPRRLLRRASPRATASRAGSDTASCQRNGRMVGKGEEEIVQRAAVETGAARAPPRRGSALGPLEQGPSRAGLRARFGDPRPSGRWSTRPVEQRKLLVHRAAHCRGCLLHGKCGRGTRLGAPQRHDDHGPQARPVVLEAQRSRRAAAPPRRRGSGRGRSPGASGRSRGARSARARGRARPPRCRARGRRPRSRRRRRVPARADVHRPGRPPAPYFSALSRRFATAWPRSSRLPWTGRSSSIVTSSGTPASSASAS